MMPNVDSRDSFFYPTLTLMIDSYNKHPLEQWLYKRLNILAEVKQSQVR